MTDTPKHLKFDYKIRFKRDRRYRLEHYNSPWDNEREIEDLRIMFEGLDLQNNALPGYKVIAWEDLETGVYDAAVKMTLYLNAEGKYEQLFELLGVTKVEK